MAARSFFRARPKLAAATTAVITVAAFIATSDDPAKSLKLCTAIPVRLVRASVTAAAISFDYEYSLWGIEEGSAEREKLKRQVHLRSARKLQEMCFKNGGIYIKLGQHIGQLEYLVPHEYVKTMRESMLNKCPVSSYDQVCEVFKKELGDTPEKIFVEFDPVPIASASLAQVHVARTADGQKVAVKVQHTHMTDTGAADQSTVGFIVHTLHRVFPTFDYRWLIDEIQETLPKELDFLVEAKNAEKCLDNFRRLSPHIADSVYAPKVYWNLSTSKLLTMEFIDGAQVDDVKTIQKLGLQPKEVAILAIKENSAKLGAGEDLYALFAGILTMRPWNKVIDTSVDHLVINGDESDRSELQMYASQYFPQISELLRRLPRVILLMLKTNDCLRTVNNSLSPGSSLETFFIIGKVSSEAIIEAKRSQRKSWLSRLDVLLEEFLLEARLLGMQLALWIFSLRRALTG